MFKLKQSSTYFWPVTLSLPGDGGAVEKSTFDAEFKRVGVARMTEIQKSVDGKDALETNSAFVREVLVGWKGIVDNDGNEMPFSETLRDQLMDIPGVTFAISNAALESIAGVQKKN